MIQRHWMSRREQVVFGVAFVLMIAVMVHLLGTSAELQERDAVRRLAPSNLIPPSARGGETEEAPRPLLTAFRIEEWRSITGAPKDVAAPPKNAEKTASGLAFKILKGGTGDTKPNGNSRVTVNYSGWTTDGKLFDSSHERAEPSEFPLNSLIKGWQEGLQLMVTGEKRRFWIPADLAYGETAGGSRPSGMLVFDVELLKIK